MEDSDRPTDNDRLNINCCRCPKVIKPGERYVSLNMTMETPAEDGTIGVMAYHDLTRLCFGCASVMLTEAIFKKQMLNPASLVDNLTVVKKRLKQDGRN